MRPAWMRKPLLSMTAAATRLESTMTIERAPRQQQQQPPLLFLMILLLKISALAQVWEKAKKRNKSFRYKNAPVPNSPVAICKAWKRTNPWMHLLSQVRIGVVRVVRLPPWPRPPPNTVRTIPVKPRGLDSYQVSDDDYYLFTVFLSKKLAVRTLGAFVRVLNFVGKDTNLVLYNDGFD